MLTNKAIVNTKSNGRTQWLREKSNDASIKGLCVRVTKAGTKTFYVHYTFNGRRKYYNLGLLSSKFTLADARDDCREIRKLIDAGFDPELERQKKLDAQKLEREILDAKQSRTTVNELLDYYLSHLDKKNTRNDARQKFAKEVRPKIGNMIAAEVTDKDIRPIVADVVKRGAQVSARHLHTFLHAAFNLAIKDDYSPFFEQWAVNPVGKVKKPADTDPDKRILSVEEIRHLWKILEHYAGMEPAMKDILRLLLLTGQRVQEVSGIQWAEIDWETMLWSIPPVRIKTRKKRNEPHILPITPMMEEIIKRRPVIQYADRLGKTRAAKAIFSGRNDPDKPLEWRSLSRAVNRLCERSEIQKFSPRQIRGTVKSHMARIKVMKEIRDRIQNHSLTDIADAHYDAHDYLDEKLGGLMKWEREMKRILGLNQTSIIDFKSA